VILLVWSGLKPVSKLVFPLKTLLKPMKQSSLSLTGVEDHPGWFKKGGYLSRLAALVCFIHFSHWANGEKMKLSALLLVFQEKC